MARMRTFLIYALLIIGFILLSTILENGLVDNMYETMTGSTNKGIYSNVDVENISGRASSVNGYMSFKLKNNSDNKLNCYAKIDLYNKQGLNCATKYVPIDLNSNSEKDYQVNFKGSNIISYSVDIVQTAPDKTNIINVLGWEIDLTNVLGMDLSNATLFGVKLSKIFTVDNAKTAGSNAMAFIRMTLASVPWWGYVIGGGIILYYMPTGFLFGIFPF